MSSDLTTGHLAEDKDEDIPEYPEPEEFKSTFNVQQTAI